MTEAIKQQISYISGLISETKQKGNLPQLDEGLRRIESEIKTIEEMCDKLPEANILGALTSLEEGLRMAIRIASAEMKQVKEIRNRWRFK